jgi:hypothetical protein
LYLDTTKSSSQYSNCMSIAEGGDVVT